MVRSTDQIRTIVAQYRRKLAGLGIRADRILLFGSHASGTHRSDSDIDLIVISSDFQRISRIRRLELLGRAAARILQPIEAYGLSPAEAESPEPGSFMQEVLAGAVTIFSTSADS